MPGCSQCGNKRTLAGKPLIAAEQSGGKGNDQCIDCRGPFVGGLSDLGLAGQTPMSFRRLSLLGRPPFEVSMMKGVGQGEGFEPPIFIAFYKEKPSSYATRGTRGSLDRRLRARASASTAVVCNDDGDCWRIKERHAYPRDVNLQIYDDDWTVTAPMTGGVTPDQAAVTGGAVLD